MKHFLPSLLLFVGCITTVLAQYPYVRNRDGLITDIPGWTGMSYHSARWEPLCGSIVTPLSANYMDYGAYCIAAMDSYGNDTRITLSYYDESGVKLVGAGVGLGRSLCLCFSMSTDGGSKFNICWYFYGDGRYAGDDSGTPYGSFRSGSDKALPSCASVDVASLEAAWSQTAIMPTYTGDVETVNAQPSTIISTVTQTQTYTLTPSLINLTISSSAVITDSNGLLTTQDRTYTTTAAVIDYEPTPQHGLSESDKIALGIGLGLGIPSLLAAICGCVYQRRRLDIRIANPASQKSA